MDYKKLASSFIQALRSTRSQNSFSQQLGYKFNIVHRWEVGTKRIMWNDLLQICKLKKISLSRILRKVYLYKGATDDQASLIRFLIKNDSLDTVSQNLNISKNIIYNSLNNKTDLSLDFMLNLLNFYSLIGIEDFLELICPVENINELRKKYTLQKSYNQIVANKPQIGLLLSILGFDFYTKLKVHSDLALAKKINEPEKQVKKYLKVLLNSGLVEIKQGKYQRQTSGIASIKNSSPEELFERDTFWLTKAISYFQENLVPEKTRCKKGFIYLPFDDNSLQDLEEATIEYFNKIQQISKKSSKKQHLRVVNINYFNPLID